MVLGSRASTKDIMITRKTVALAEGIAQASSTTAMIVFDYCSLHLLSIDRIIVSLGIVGQRGLVRHRSGGFGRDTLGQRLGLR